MPDHRLEGQVSQSGSDEGRMPGDGAGDRA